MIMRAESSIIKKMGKIYKLRPHGCSWLKTDNSKVTETIITMARNVKLMYA